MLKVGFVGWRGMVGSVLMQRMCEENDFANIEPFFFSTSQVGLAGPDIGKPGANTIHFLIRPEGDTVGSRTEKATFMVPR